MTLWTTARRDEASNEGCNSGPTGHDFTDNSYVQGLSTQARKELLNTSLANTLPFPPVCPPPLWVGPFALTDWVFSQMIYAYLSPSLKVRTACVCKVYF
jgi:hypothetical protein